MLKNTRRQFHGISQQGCIEERKNDAYYISPGRDDQITTSAKLQNIMYESYGFSGDLVETIN